VHVTLTCECGLALNVTAPPSALPAIEASWRERHGCAPVPAFDFDFDAIDAAAEQASSCLVAATIVLGLAVAFFFVLIATGGFR
jgi:hypothetical protein